MLRRCRNSIPKRVSPSGISSWLTLVPVAALRTKHGTSQDATARSSPESPQSVERCTSTSMNRLRVLSPLARALHVPQGRTRRKIRDSAPSLRDFFLQLPRLLKRQGVSAAALWSLVQKTFASRSISNQHRFTRWQKSLLSQLLDRVLNEWATQGNTSASIQPLVLLRIYMTRRLMRRIDWVYALGFLAKTAYQRTSLHQTESLGGVLTLRMTDAIRLRVLCKAWRLFLTASHHKPSNCKDLAHSYENLWPELHGRGTQAGGVESGNDFAKSFVRSIAEQYSIGDADLDRYLAHSAILTLVTLYRSLRTVSTDGIGALKEYRGTSSQASTSANDERGYPTSHPNWHLGSGQETYWMPEIGHLSVSEASILRIIAHAAKNASLNLTLLRITLGQMSVPEADVQEIARTFQGFQLAIPTILAKFQDFKYDENVCKAGRFRRYPFKAYLDGAVASNDIAALDHAGSIVESSSGIIKSTFGDALNLVKTCLQMDRPRRALRYWNTLTQLGNPGEQAWSLWLGYAAQKGDHVAFEAAWSRLHANKIRRTSKMWRQRLLLLHQNNQSLVAWDHFRTLVRFTGKNRKLVGVHMPWTCPRNIDVEMFHLMIQGNLDKASYQTEAILRAKDTLELLHKQQGLKVKRDTYMLFVRHFLTTNSRQSAVEWYVEGHSKDIKFLPSDYGLLFEYDLVTHGRKNRQPLADPLADIRHVFDAISNTMRLVFGQRLLIWSNPQAAPLSSRVDWILRDKPFIDSVDDSPGDPKMKEIQAAYAGLMQHLALNFAHQASNAAKTARLRLLLLLWDHCIITNVPASTAMKSTLSSVVYSLHPELQEKLMRGAMFENYDVNDSVTFHSYRFLRLIGPQWFAQRVKSIPSSTVKPQLTTLLWNGYDGVNDKALIDAGIASLEDRRKILAETMTWRNEAVAKRTQAAKRKKGGQKSTLERESQAEEQAGELDDANQQLRLAEEQLANHIQLRGQGLKESKKLDMVRAKNEAERRLVLEEPPSESSNAPIGRATIPERPHVRSQPPLPRHEPLRYDFRALREQPLADTRFEDTQRGCVVSTADKGSVIHPGGALRGRFRRRRRRVAIATDRDSQPEDRLWLYGSSTTRRVYKGI